MEREYDITVRYDSKAKTGIDKPTDGQTDLLFLVFPTPVVDYFNMSTTFTFKLTSLL